MHDERLTVAGVGFHEVHVCVAVQPTMKNEQKMKSPSQENGAQKSDDTRLNIPQMFAGLRDSEGLLREIRRAQQHLLHTLPQLVQAHLLRGRRPDGVFIRGRRVLLAGLEANIRSRQIPPQYAKHNNTGEPFLPSLLVPLTRVRDRSYCTPQSHCRVVSPVDGGPSTAAAQSPFAAAYPGD